MIVRMSAVNMTGWEISCATGFSSRTIRRILAMWRDHRRVVNPPIAPGRRRSLSSIDCDYIEGLIQRNPEIHLDEIVESLAAARQVKVSASTVSRTLKRCGFTRKRVDNTSHLALATKYSTLLTILIQITKPTLERHEGDRAEDQDRMAQCEAERIKSVDVQGTIGIPPCVLPDIAHNGGSFP